MAHVVLCLRDIQSQRAVQRQTNLPAVGVAGQNQIRVKRGQHLGSVGIVRQRDDRFIWFYIFESQFWFEITEPEIV